MYSTRSDVVIAAESTKHCPQGFRIGNLGPCSASLCGYFVRSCFGGMPKPCFKMFLVELVVLIALLVTFTRLLCSSFVFGPTLLCSVLFDACVVFDNCAVVVLTFAKLVRRAFHFILIVVVSFYWKHCHMFGLFFVSALHVPLFQFPVFA